MDILLAILAETRKTLPRAKFDDLASWGSLGVTGWVGYRLFYRLNEPLTAQTPVPSQIIQANRLKGSK